MNFPDHESIFITEDEAGIRLDKVLASRFQEIKSRNYFQNLIEKGHVLLNGDRVKKRVLPKSGDEIEINFLITHELNLTPENIPLDIVYEDEDLLVVNKPAGMVVHPAPGHWTGTFVHALLYHVRDLYQDHISYNTHGCYPRPGIVHRLDKDTTGLLIAAKNSVAHERLVTMFMQKQIHKEYYAICVGNPGNKEVKNLIGRNPVERKEMAVVTEGGKEAISVVKTIAYNEKFSLVNIDLKTGRTHQIRVHMKHLGTPILGCPIYGLPQVNKKYLAKRQMLHAGLLRFNHPIKNEPLEFKLDLPSDMEHFISSFNF